MEEIMREIQSMFISSMISRLIEEDKLDGFIEFARERAKQDNMDSEELMDFFDDLEAQFCNNIDWEKTLDIVQKVTGCNVMGFKGDQCIIIENEEMTDDECQEYLSKEIKSKIHLEQINQALQTVNVKLEFTEAMNIPFDVGGFQNFCRFKVIELE